MAKRVALICEGKSSGFDKRELSELFTLRNSVRRVSDTLEAYGEWKPERYELEDEQALEQRLEATIIENPDLESLLFYYIGHGYLEDTRYCIVGRRQETIDIKFALRKIDDPGRDLSVSIVIDACESREFVVHWDDEKQYEILTASNRRSAYEIKEEDLTYFSKQFCDAIQYYIADGEVYLKNIQAYVKDDYKNLPYDKKQISNLKTPLDNINTNELNIIAFEKKYIDLKKQLKAYYQIQQNLGRVPLFAFRRDILRYYPDGINNYKAIKKAQSIDELFTILVKDVADGYLYCVLKSIGMDHEELETLKSKECPEVQKKIGAIITIVSKEKNRNNIDVWNAEFYKQYTDETVEADSDHDVMDLSWEEFYPMKLKQIIQKILNDNPDHDQKVELQIIVPFEKISNLGFNDFMIRPDVDEDYELAWNRVFQISIKIQERLQDYSSEQHSPTKRWKKNLDNYQKARQQKIGDRCYGGDIANLSNYNAVVSLSERDLTAQDHFDAYYFGVPFLIAPEQESQRCKVLAHIPDDKEKEATLDEKEKRLMRHYKDWKKEHLGVFKEATFRLIGELPPMRLICDDEYDEEFLREIDQ